MRILHILDHSLPLHSGYAFRSCAIIRAQRALGWETMHVTGSRQGLRALPDEVVDGLHFYRTRRRGGVLARLPLASQVEVVASLGRRLRQLIPEIRPDLLHVHSPSLNALAALAEGKRFGLPIVYEVRAFWEDAAVDHGTAAAAGLRYCMSRALETHVLNRADAVTTICEGLRTDILGRGLAPGKVTVIPNAVDLDKFQVGAMPDPELKRRLGLQGTSLIGFIGSFYAYEGLDILLRAVPALVGRHPRLRVLLVGGGPQERALRQLASELKIRDKVVFTGRVPHSQVQQYYKLLDVLVYPRLHTRLTDLVTPLKPLEAMAQGRVLAASNVGGHRELIDHGRHGVLFEAGSPGALAEHVGTLLAQPERWPALRANARRLVETERNWPASVSRYRDIYTTLTGLA